MAITVSKLKEILNTMPDDALIVVANDFSDGRWDYGLINGFAEDVDYVNEYSYREREFGPGSQQIKVTRAVVIR
jgi:hypothetical protein